MQEQQGVAFLFRYPVMNYPVLVFVSLMFKQKTVLVLCMVPS